MVRTRREDVAGKHQSGAIGDFESKMAASGHHKRRFSSLARDKNRIHFIRAKVPLSSLNHQIISGII